MKNFYKIFNKIYNNIFLAYIVTVITIFLIVIPNSPLDEAVVGSLFFGILALPTITPIVLGLIALLIPQENL
jgi:hypothetical protein